MEYSSKKICIDQYGISLFPGTVRLKHNRKFHSEETPNRTLGVDPAMDIVVNWAFRKSARVAGQIGKA
jgi:hypothetical protein